MQENNAKAKTKKTLPGWAGWLIGYAAVLAAAAGLVYYWRVVFWLPAELPVIPFTLGVAGLFTLLYLALFALCRLRGDNKICLKATLVVVLCGLLFCFATAPLQAPDEQKHFLRAYAISQGHFTYEYTEPYPNDVDLLAQHFSTSPVPLNHAVMYQGREMASASMAEYRMAVETGEKAEKKVEAPVLFMLLPFLHQGLFMAVARWMGFSALGLLYAGRLANLCLYALLCYFAFKNSRQYRNVMFAFALLPVSLFMGASCSYDGPMLALCFLMMSYFGKEEFNQRDLLVFLVALAVACYIKPNNVVLAALLLLIPKSRWKVKWNPWLVTLSVAAVSMAFWWGLGAVDSGLLKHGYPKELGRGSGVAADPPAQLLHVLSYPLAFVARALQSVYEADGFLFDLGRLGSMDLVLPLVGGLSVLSLCLASALSVRDREDNKTGAVIGLLLMAALYAAAVLGGMYLLDTDLESTRITGAQPRYFLPVFLLVFTAAAIFLGRAVRPRLANGGALLKTESVYLWVAAGVAVFAALLLFQNYYIGQWIPKADGGWKLVNLFGWVKK